MDTTLLSRSSLSMQDNSVSTSVELPVDCFQLMWERWLGFRAPEGSPVKDQGVELHSMSMRLISKGFNTAFHNALSQHWSGPRLYF